MESEDQNTQAWRRCSSCKHWIAFDHPYYECSVSTCTRKRTGLVFCSVSCWEVHVPMLRHRDAGAVEARSPSRAVHARVAREEAERKTAPAVERKLAPAQREPQRTIVRRAGAPASGAAPREPAAPQASLSDDFPVDVLIVASKLKQYIKARSGMNTSDAVLQVLSEHVRALCDEAIHSAERNERKTVMDRDFSKPR